jgi:hypothetical protein
MEHLKPSATNPMLGVLGSDSSSSDGVGDVGRRGTPLSNDVEAGALAATAPWTLRS